jgi:urease accessory protein
MSSLASLVRLLQLASPSLPVGAYSYSQGLESAIDSGIVHDAPSAARWIADVLELSIATLDAPVVFRLMETGDRPGLSEWNDYFIASRETAELRAETLQMGHSLRRLLGDMGVEGSAALDALDEIAYPAAFAFAACAWKIEPRDALAAYVFSWAENQVLAAVKAIPLGQTDGQRLVSEVSARIPALVEHAMTLADDELANFAPGLAILSARHESQYSRLFRS